MHLWSQLAELMVLVEPKLYREYAMYSSSGVSDALGKDSEGPVQHVGVSFRFLQAAQEEIGR